MINVIVIDGAFRKHMGNQEENLEAYGVYKISYSFGKQLSVLKLYHTAYRYQIGVFTSAPHLFYIYITPKQRMADLIKN